MPRAKGRITVVVVVGFLLLAAQHAGPAWAGVIYVKADVSGANNGSSWADAYTDLQTALAAARSGDEIWVAAGTYKPTIDIVRTISFVMKEGVTLRGGFRGTETDLAQRNWETNPTILSGDIGTTDTLDNSYHVVRGASSAVLDGFTITGGNTTSSGGSGMNNSGCSPTVANCLFTGNAGIFGGGMYNNNGSTVTLVNCVFSGNTGGTAGGGICSYRSSLTLTSCTFSGNTADWGGGMYNYTTSITAADCAFTSNTAAVRGGGMFNYLNAVNLTNCVFYGNTATDHGGGLINQDSLSPVVTNCTFVGNVAVDRAGGMQNSSCSPTFANCIIWNNVAPRDPEIYKQSGGISIFRHCDIKNSGGSGPSWNSAIGTDGGGNVDYDPLFTAPATPAGADGLWRTDDDGLRLRVNSPCIGAADPALAPETDIRGLLRKNGPEIGAYEFVPANVSEFIEHFYQSFLNREPEPGAVDRWRVGYMEHMLNCDVDARLITREMARIFLDSPEYAARNRSDEEFLRDCYMAFLWRAPSQGELDGWLGGAWTRGEALTCLGRSEEFSTLMENLFPNSQGDATRNFVTGMYIGTFDRPAEAGGLLYWADVLNQADDKRAAAKTMARVLFTSAEYIGMNQTAEDTVIRLYRSFLGRFPGEDEVAYWAGELKTGRLTLDQAIELFGDSVEFATILNRYFPPLAPPARANDWALYQ